MLEDHGKSRAVGSKGTGTLLPHHRDRMQGGKSLMQDDMANIVHKVVALLAACKAMEEKSKDYLIVSDEKPDIAAELLDSLMIVEELMGYVNPELETGEIFGLPKQAVVGAKAAKQLMNQQGWDFNPWFWEKTSSIKKCIVAIYQVWKTELTDEQPGGTDPAVYRQNLRRRLEINLTAAVRYAAVVFEMTCGDKIRFEE